MRHIGDLSDETHARRLGDYLLANGIKSAVEPEQDRWAVWVIDEDHVEQARAEFARFQDDPDDDRYAKAKQVADDRRREAQRQEQQYRKNAVDVRRQWQRPLLAQTPVTAALIAASVAVAVMTSSFRELPALCDRTEPLLTYFYIVPMFGVPGEPGRVKYNPGEGLNAVRRGQVHRLVTPIFIHLGILHLLFNMLWLRILGNAIEFRRGTLRLLGMVLVIAVSSNLAQFWLKGPAFGGMSGVVFGLFGYVWMKTLYDPGAGLYVSSTQVFLMMAWFVFCFIGPLNIANAAHTVGLVAGVVMGLWGTLLKRMSR